MMIKPVNLDDTQTQYQAYLQTQAWRDKALQRLKIDNNTCQGCGSRGTSTNPLEVHHLTYHNVYHEDVNKDLVTLCKCCHTLTHTIMNRITNESTGQRGWKDSIIPYLYPINLDGIHQEYIREGR